MKDRGGVPEQTRIGKRILLIRLPNGLEAHIASPKNSFMLIFLPIWLFLWTIGGILASWSLFNGKSMEQLFILIWLCFWLATEVVVAYAFLWLAFGEERILIRQRMLEMSKVVFRPCSQKSFPVVLIRNPRASGSFGSPFSLNASLAHWGLTGGNIAFEIQDTTYRFGIRLEEKDAMALVQALAQEI